MVVVVVLHDSFRGIEGIEELYGDTTAGPRPKVWTRGQKWK